MAPKGDKAPSDRQNGPYGYVLILRALADAAIAIGSRYPAALRVFCLLAEYMDQHGRCRVGQDTIAARLDITRQAVNKQVRILREENIIEVTRRAGATVAYNIVALDDHKEGRSNEYAAVERREEKRLAKRLAKHGTYRFQDRPGFDEYKRVQREKPGDPAAALRAMEQYEYIVGCRFERVDRDQSVNTGLYHGEYKLILTGRPAETTPKHYAGGMKPPDVAPLKPSEVAPDATF